MTTKVYKSNADSSHYLNSEGIEEGDFSAKELNEIFPKLVKAKILVFSRKVGRAKMYIPKLK